MRSVLKRLSLCAAGAMLSQLGMAAEGQQVGTYSGDYSYDFEVSVLTPDGSKEQWCISGDMSAARLHLPYGQASWGTAKVTLQGVLGPAGSYGHLGECSHILTIKKIIRISNKKIVIFSDKKSKS